MKKLLTLLILLLPLMSFAEESPSQGIQQLVENDNKANITFMKQPLSKDCKQNVKVERNWFCITIVNNGKILETEKDK